MWWLFNRLIHCKNTCVAKNTWWIIYSSFFLKWNITAQRKDTSKGKKKLLFSSWGFKKINLQNHIIPNINVKVSWASFRENEYTNCLPNRILMLLGPTKQYSPAEPRKLVVTAKILLIFFFLCLRKFVFVLRNWCDMEKIIIKFPRISSAKKYMNLD